MTATSKRMQGHAEWLVVLVVAIALVAGWGLKSYAETRVERYTASGVTVLYPAGWLPSKAPDGTLRFRDTHAGARPAVITVRPAAAADAQSAAGAVAAEAGGLALDRAMNWIAYHVITADGKASFRGQPAQRVSYVYVDDSANVFQQSLPTVMMGEDLVTYQEGRVYVFSVQAPQGEFAQAQRHFEALVGSVSFGAK